MHRIDLHSVVLIGPQNFVSCLVLLLYNLCSW